MLICKIILITILFLECLLSIAIKYNFNGIQDKIIKRIYEIDLKQYLSDSFSFNIFMNSLIILFLVLLS